MNKHFRYSDWASKFVCTILLCLLFTFSRSQGKELQGKWVLDITLEEDGNSVSVRHPMFSAYLVYEFKDTQLFINDKPLSVTYMESNTIKTPYQTLHYTLDSIYLFVREQNENVTLAFLREEDFLNHNPVFRSKTVIRDGKEVIVKNDFTDIRFDNELELNHYIIKNTPLLDKQTHRNIHVEVEFIVDTTNNIRDIRFLSPVDPSMQKQCTRTIERSKRYFHNNTGKDVLITENFNFFKMFEGIDGNQTKQAYEYYRKGEKLFTIGDYEHAIMEYEKAKINEIDPKRYGGLFYNDLIIHLGISYIATEQKEKACNTFRLIGDETNFRVRNYLKFFCL